MTPLSHVHAVVDPAYSSRPQTSVTVEVCRNQERWDDYVNSRPESSNYHRWLWGDLVKETYGHEFYRLSATTDGAVHGVLPLCFVKSRLFGKFLLSMPFFSYGGVVADDEVVSDHLFRAASELAEGLGAGRIELRQGKVLPTSWVRKSPKVTMQVQLPSTTDELWARLSSGMRNKIRGAKKNGLRVEWSGPEGLEQYYKVWSTNMRNLGSPAYPRSWFRNICTALPQETRFVTVWDGKDAVASGITHSFRDTIELPWSGSLPESRKKYSAVLLYWSLLEWAVQNGYRYVDLGRCTRGGGTYEFKRHFGCSETPLHWYYWYAPGCSVTETQLDNPRYRFATKVWQHLPLAVANQLGPRIVRSIP